MVESMLRQDNEYEELDWTDSTRTDSHWDRRTLWTSAAVYHIDSFFDVFTELRVGGPTGTWIPCDDSTYMFLIPEPCSALLLELGTVALTRQQRR